MIAFPVLYATGMLACSVEGSGSSGDFGVLSPGKVGTGDAAAGGLPDMSGAGAAGGTSNPSSGDSSSSSSSGQGGGGSSSSSGCGPDVASPDATLPDTADPEAGQFTLDEALLGLPEGPGPLRAILDTDLGTVTCELRPDKAPIGVANFVGLARGTRAWKDPSKNQWVKRRFYDGLLIYRIQPSQYIVGGDFFNNGQGPIGYTSKDELSDLKNVAGTLGYVPVNTGVYDSIFYVAATTLPAEDGKNTVFGLCSPGSVIADISKVPVSSAGKPNTDIRLKKVTITRCAP